MPAVWAAQTERLPLTMGGSRLTTHIEHWRRRTPRSSSVKRHRQCDRLLRNSSFCFSDRGEADPTSDARNLGRTGDKRIRSFLALPSIMLRRNSEREHAI